MRGIALRIFLGGYCDKLFLMFLCDLLTRGVSVQGPQPIEPHGPRAPWGPRARRAPWGPRAPPGGRLWALWDPRAPPGAIFALWGPRALTAWCKRAYLLRNPQQSCAAGIFGRPPREKGVGKKVRRRPIQGYGDDRGACPVIFVKCGEVLRWLPKACYEGFPGFLEKKTGARVPGPQCSPEPGWAWAWGMGPGPMPLRSWGKAPTTFGTGARSLGTFGP